MKAISWLILTFFPLVLQGQGRFTLVAQEGGYFSFELINNIIIVPVHINGQLFNFLLDTGVKETLLFVSSTDSIALNQQEPMLFQGLGSEEGVSGILSINNKVEVGGIMLDSLHNLYVFKGEDLALANEVGFPVNGILGSRFFVDHAIHIDYIKKRIKVFPAAYDLDAAFPRYKNVPITLIADRPYIHTPVQLADEDKEFKLLIDMGNADPLMLFAFLADSLLIKPPFVEEYIGRGFNGAIYGKRNRIKGFEFGGEQLSLPIVSYPDANAVYQSKLVPNRRGSIGNQTLQRFSIVFDYPNQRILLKKNKNFKKPFLMNMSGISISHEGMVWQKAYFKNQKEEDQELFATPGTRITFNNDHYHYHFELKPSYVVSGLRKGSPAERAGLQKGDLLLKINGHATSNLSLEKLLARLQSHPNDKIKLQVQRGEQLLTIKFTLEEPIPFLE